MIKNNVSTAIAHGGRADVFGAGIITASSLTMRKVVISDNRGFARGDDGGTVQGGGIWNGAFDLPFLQGLHSNLSLDHVRRAPDNSVAGSAGEVASGGGIYTRDPITRAATIIKRNHPDQCFGCSTATAAKGRAGRRSAAQPRRTTSNTSEYIEAANRNTQN